MTRGTWAVAAFVVSLFSAAVGVSSGVQGDHRAAIPAMIFALVALFVGTALWKK